MRFTSRETTYTLLATGSAILAAKLARAALKSGWRALRHDDPPENPAEIDTDWKEAILWSVATGVAVGLARLLAQRGAAAGWNMIAGRRPKGGYHT